MPNKFWLKYVGLESDIDNHRLLFVTYRFKKTYIPIMRDDWYYRSKKLEISIQHVPQL